MVCLWGMSSRDCVRTQPKYGLGLKALSYCLWTDMEEITSCEEDYYKVKIIRCVLSLSKQT